MTLDATTLRFIPGDPEVRSVPRSVHQCNGITLGIRFYPEGYPELLELQARERFYGTAGTPLRDADTAWRSKTFRHGQEVSA